MAIFDTEFIFCCSCLCLIFFVQCIKITKKKSEFACFVNRQNPTKSFDIDNFKNENSMFITCFEHLGQSMYLDNCVSLHYYKSTFYRTIIEKERI